MKVLLQPNIGISQLQAHRPVFWLRLQNRTCRLVVPAAVSGPGNATGRANSSINASTLAQPEALVDQATEVMEAVLGRSVQA